MPHAGRRRNALLVAGFIPDTKSADPAPVVQQLQDELRSCPEKEQLLRESPSDLQFAVDDRVGPKELRGSPRDHPDAGQFSPECLAIRRRRAKLPRGELLLVNTLRGRSASRRRGRGRRVVVARAVRAASRDWGPRAGVVQRPSTGREVLSGLIVSGLLHAWSTARCRVMCVSVNGDENTVDSISLDTSTLVQLGKIAVDGGNAQAKVLMRKLARSLRTSHPLVADEIVSILRASPVRAASGEARIEDPVDLDSRLPLLRREDPVVLPHEPIYPERLRGSLEQLVLEHHRSDALYSAGLAPTRTALFVGPPGVGKTLGARWVAQALDLPLLVLDLSSVMSSFLGRTGGNLRRVFDYARTAPCVLLLDELDAVAKKRDDSSEIGELKRLVTVLLQEIDAWPEGSLMLAATNHSELLDPAVWRRFESVLTFDLPGRSARAAALAAYLGDENVKDEVRVLVAEATEGNALSALEADVLSARRSAALGSENLDEALVQVACARLQILSPQQRARLVASIVSSEAMSQRQASALTGVSRDTIRKYMDQKPEARNA